MSKYLHGWTFFTLLLAVVSVYSYLAWYEPIGYMWMTYEDLYGEWGQTYFFAAGAVFSGVAAARASVYRWFFILLMLACLYTVMEEISWGQRVFGFSSPDFFKSRNLQGETNLHNFLVGPYRTDLKMLLEIIMALALSGYGVIYPVLLKMGWKTASWFEGHGLAAPPLYLSPAFLIAAYLELSPFSFNEAEVAEMLVGLSVATLSLHYAYTLSKGVRPLHSNEWVSALSLRLAVLVVAMAASVVGLAFLTTERVYASPEWRERVDRRLANGVEKFAKRYERYERWDVAIALHTQVLRGNPRSTSSLRRLASVNLKAGNLEEHDHLLNQALTLNQARVEASPNSTSALRSLALTYHALGDEKRADLALAQALQIAQDRVAAKPDSASAAYALGMTYKLLGRNLEALSELKRAHMLRPTRSKYRKAYWRQKTRLGLD